MYLKDTTEFLNKLNQISCVSMMDWLVTLHFTQIYLMKQAWMHYIRTVKLPSQYIVDLTTLVLTQNYIFFEKYLYLQIQGTAMDSPIALNYANLFMGKFEQDYVYNNNPFHTNKKVWMRYIGDFCMIWSGSEQELDLLLTFIQWEKTGIQYTFCMLK